MSLIDNINEQYKGHYKFISEIKRKAELKRKRRTKILIAALSFIVTLSLIDVVTAVNAKTLVPDDIITKPAPCDKYGKCLQ